LRKMGEWECTLSMTLSKTYIVEEVDNCLGFCNVNPQRQTSHRYTTN